MFLVCLYVDDLLITRSNEREINKFKGCMMAEFEMSNLGELTYLWGMEFIPTNKGIFMHKKSMQQISEEIQHVRL